MLVHVSGWQANSTDNLNLTWYFRSLLQNRLILLRGHNPSDQPSAWRRLTQKCFIPVGSFQLTTPRFWESHDEKGHVISLGQCTLHLHSLPSTKRLSESLAPMMNKSPFSLRRTARCSLTFRESFGCYHGNLTGVGSHWRWTSLVQPHFTVEETKVEWTNLPKDFCSLCVKEQVKFILVVIQKKRE